MTSGLSGSVVVRVAPGRRYRQDVDLGVIRQTMLVRADDAWTTTLSGQVQSLSAHDRDKALLDGLMLLPSGLHGPTEVDFSLVGDERFEGIDCTVLRTLRNGGTTVEYLVARDGRLHATRTIGSGRRRVTRYLDWRLVDGVRFPFAEITTGDEPTDRTEVRYTTIQLDVPLDANAFDKPDSASRVAFGTAGSSGWLPYDFVNGNRIFISAEVGGRKVQVLLDSGAEATVLDRRFVAASGLGVRGEVTARGVGGASTAGMVPNLQIRLGALTLSDVTAAAIDMSEVSKHLGHDLPVVLGAEIFRECVVEIDFAKRRIAFHDPASFVAPKDAVALPVSTSGGMYTIEANLDGRPAKLDLDLGSGSPLFLYPRFWSNSPLATPGHGSTTIMGGVGGLKEARITTMKRVEIAGALFGAVPVELHGQIDAVSATGGSDGNIGLPLLARFHLIVDLPHDRVWFGGHPDTATQFPKDRSGLALLPEGARLRILHVATGSPAAKAGLLAGEVIERVAGGGLDSGSWRYGPPGTTVALELVGGRKIHLNLADYF